MIMIMIFIMMLYQVTFNQFSAALDQGFCGFLSTRPTIPLSVKFKPDLGIIIRRDIVRLKISIDSQWFCRK